jgi:hypothetical protein
VKAFEDYYQQLRQAGLITLKMLQQYEEANTKSLHGRLQGILMLAGNRVGLWAFPEIKYRLKIPIDKRKFGKKNYQRTIKVDIGFYNNENNLCGIGEVFTLDMLHEGDPNLSGVGVRASHKLLHMAKEEKFNGFFLIVITLPKEVKQRPPWRRWKEKWNRVSQRLE